MKTRSHPRGSALVLAMVLVLVLAVIAVAVVKLGTAETAGAAAGARRAALSGCAEAATRLLMSKFHLIGVNPTAITALNVPLDGPGGKSLAVGGHIDGYTGTGWGVSIGQVVPLPPGSLGPVEDVNDETNILPGGLGKASAGYKVTVHCQDHGDGTPTSGRQLEIELGVRFGL
jgi:hypothetical protein